MKTVCLNYIDLFYRTHRSLYKHLFFQYPVCAQLFSYIV